jgi:hypothetical protein
MSGKPAYLCLDTRGDRHEIHDLLTRLSPRARIGFMKWACQQATLPHSTRRPGVSRKTVRLAQRAERDSSADRVLALDLYFDVWHLAMNYDFDLNAALEKLVEMVRQQ